VAEGADGLSSPPLAGLIDTFSGAFDFIVQARPSAQAGSDVMVGGPDQIGELLISQTLISVAALGIALLLALPLGIYLGHRGVGEFLAVAVGNAGRAVPELGLIAILYAYFGGTFNLTVIVIVAVMVLGIPPILTNAFVGVSQVDRGAIDAARGIGMTELEIILKVELPLAAPTIMGGVRTAAVTIVATSTIGSITGAETLGKLILGQNVYGIEGVVAGAIMVALLALAFELVLAGVQRLLTPPGIALQRRSAAASA
jgi:osmoprotectant transport system permease protein